MVESLTDEVERLTSPVFRTLVETTERERVNRRKVR